MLGRSGTWQSTRIASRPPALSPESLHSPREAHRPPHPLRPRRQDALEQQPRPHAGGGDAPGIRLRPHAKTHKSPDLARVQIARGAVGICCAKLGEAEVFADAGIADIRLPYPLNPVNADRVLRCSIALASRSSSTTCESRGPGRTRCAPPAARSTCWSRSTSASTAAASIRREQGAPSSWRASRSCRAALPRPAQPRRPRLRRRVRERDGSDRRREAQMLTTLADRRRKVSAYRVEEISVGATPTARFSVAAAGHHRAAARQLRLLRSHAGRARRRDVGRLRADRPGARRQPSGARSHHPRLRQQDADERSGARLHATRRASASSSRRLDRPGRRRVAARRAAVGRARDRPRARQAAPLQAPAISSASCRITPASSRTSSTPCGSWTATRCSTSCGLPVAADARPRITRITRTGMK